MKAVEQKNIATDDLQQENLVEPHEATPSPLEERMVKRNNHTTAQTLIEDRKAIKEVIFIQCNLQHGWLHGDPTVKKSKICRR